MSTGSEAPTDGQSAENGRSAEERAEELVQRVVSNGSRVFGKVFGRVREEAEDIYAEARAIRDRSRQPEPK